jgi:hypothetical protein
MLLAEGWFNCLVVNFFTLMMDFALHERMRIEVGAEPENKFRVG